MSNMIHYNFSIGDKVKLLKSPDDAFTIKGWGWRIKEGNTPVPYYKLSGQENNKYILSYWEEFKEDALEAVGETNPHDEDASMLSTDGKELHIGMKVYGSVYRKYYQQPMTCNIGFGFAGYGTITSLHFYKSDDQTIDEVKVKREFLTTFEDGKERLDAARKGYENTYSSYEITVEIPDDYSEQYVNELVNDKIHYDALEPTCADWKRYEVDQWLNHIGVYEQVLKLYAEKKAAGECPYLHEIEEKKQKKQQNMHEKLNAIIGSLTDEEKAELKKML